MYLKINGVVDKFNPVMIAKPYKLYKEYRNEVVQKQINYLSGS